LAKPNPRVIDAHMHWYPQEFVDLMIKKGPANGAVMGEDDKGNPVVESVPGCTQKSTMRRKMTNLEDIIAAMVDEQNGAWKAVCLVKDGKVATEARINALAA